MREEILKLLHNEILIQQKLSNLNNDRNIYLARILLVRQIMEVRRKINLFTPEEIYTAKNFYALKRQMYRMKLRRLALVQANETKEEELEAKEKEPDFLELYFMLLMLSFSNNSFFRLSEIITTKTENYQREMNDKFNLKKK